MCVCVCFHVCVCPNKGQGDDSNQIFLIPRCRALFLSSQLTWGKNHPPLLLHAGAAVQQLERDPPTFIAAICNSGCLNLR